DSTDKEESKEARKEKEVKDFRVKKAEKVDEELDKEVAMDAESQGRLNQEDVNATSKGVSAVSAPELVSATDLTVFDDEDAMHCEMWKVQQGWKFDQGLKDTTGVIAQSKKNQNCGNKTRNKSVIGKARGKTYVLGGGDANPDSNVVTEPTRLQDAVCMANNIMDQKLKGYAMKNAENKRKFNNSQKHNHVTARRITMDSNHHFKDKMLEDRM
nr:hypothetical protein [Tanacetum cinerariifolium]